MSVGNILFVICMCECSCLQVDQFLQRKECNDSCHGWDFVKRLTQWKWKPQWQEQQKVGFYFDLIIDYTYGKWTHFSCLNTKDAIRSFDTDLTTEPYVNRLMQFGKILAKYELNEIDRLLDGHYQTKIRTQETGLTHKKYSCLSFSKWKLSVFNRTRNYLLSYIFVRV